MLLEKWLLLRESAYATQLIFTSVVLKKKIDLLKLKVARKKLTQEGSPLLDNYSLFFTLVEKEVAELMPSSFCNEEQW